MSIAHITLHVGLGTFRPVKTENIVEHEMHSEYYIVEQEQADKINQAKKRAAELLQLAPQAPEH